MNDPLLLALLSQTQQLIDQVGETDWPAVVIGAGATLVGALAGAWIGAERGARAGYKASLKAGLDLERRAKLEEIHAVVDDLRHGEYELLADLQEGVGRRAEVSELIEFVEENGLNLAERKQPRLRTLCEIYLPECNRWVGSIHDALFDVFAVSVELVESPSTVYWDEASASLDSARNDYLIALNSISKAIQAQLVPGE